MQNEKPYKASPVNLNDYRAHYFYAYGDTKEEALQKCLDQAKERDEKAYIREGVVYFRQPVYF